MKNKLTTIAAVAIISIALTLLAMTIMPKFASLIEKKPTEVLSSSSKCFDFVESTSKDGQFFSSIEEYLEFIGVSDSDSSRYDSTQIYNWAELSVPNDADLVNVFACDEGTVFNYYLSRNYDKNLLTSPRDDVSNIIDIYPGYDLIEGLLHALIQKDYSLDPNNITNVSAFAEALADDLGCDPDIVNNYATRYKGEVYVQDFTSGTLPQVYLVGYQTLVYTYVPNQPAHIVYTYTPVSLTEAETSALFETMDYYLCADHIDE